MTATTLATLSSIPSTVNKKSGKSAVKVPGIMNVLRSLQRRNRIKLRVPKRGDRSDFRSARATAISLRCKRCRVSIPKAASI